MKKTIVEWPVGFKTTLTPVIQGQFHITSDPAVAFSTVLGSCISVCLYDESRKIGGMNHYLLAEGGGGSANSLRYGAHAMELLINALLKEGTSRNQLKAKVFGGAAMSGHFSHIGPRNAEFALEYLKDEEIPVISSDVGGTSSRRVNFHAATGKARSTKSEAPQEEIQPLMEKELRNPTKPAAPATELF